jgi:PGF-CTERM protein
VIPTATTETPAETTTTTERPTTTTTTTATSTITTERPTTTEIPTVQTPTTTPGFGVLASLVALAGAALLALRRD